MQRIKNILLNRFVIVALSILVQLLTIAIIIWRFSNYFVIFDVIFTVISILAVLYILNSRSDPAYKVAWIIPIMLFPIFGGLFYLMVGGAGLSNKMKKHMSQITDKMKECLNQNQNTLRLLAKENSVAFNQGKYIEKYTLCPVYNNSSTEFLPSGEDFFENLLKELKSAEKYIFLEFFIIEEGVMWNTILEILKEKAKKGVDVRVIYDDFGCLTKLPARYNKNLENMGIKCCVFNPFIPVLSLRLNNRDHRKIAVIDGRAAFTGGANLADEYINAVEKYGHWRDCGIMVKGDAVWSLTVMFLSMWTFLRKSNEDYSKFKPVNPENKEECYGYVQPFDDSPLDDEHVSEAVYLNLINQAEKYIYIETPYLIADNKMMVALCLAAKRGVDVRILTPNIPDKKYAFAVTQSSYEELLEAGVSIYQYTPGFNHGKTFVVDDDYAVVGTINLDYRSLYLHFECGVWMYNTKSVGQVKSSTLKALEISEKITLEHFRNMSKIRRILRTILKIFAPLM
ncbi:MAG: cardiolipin synthase [Sedimentibacter sp.]